MVFTRRASGHDARVGGHDAVDVGPDFDGAGVEAAADERGGVVGAAAAERGGDRRCEEPMKPPMTGMLPSSMSGKDLVGERGFDGGLVGRGLAVVVVGEDDGARVDVGGCRCLARRRRRRR